MRKKAWEQNRYESSFVPHFAVNEGLSKTMNSYHCPRKYWTHNIMPLQTRHFRSRFQWKYSTLIHFFLAPPCTQGGAGTETGLKEKRPHVICAGKLLKCLGMTWKNYQSFVKEIWKAE